MKLISLFQMKKVHIFTKAILTTEIQIVITSCLKRSTRFVPLLLYFLQRMDTNGRRLTLIPLTE